MIDRFFRVSLRSSCEAASIIMIAFFFTIPISMMMPIAAITSSSMPNSISVSSAPKTADGRPDRMVMG